MSPSELFRRLGAPLRNVQWSWGAADPAGRIFLRAWQDETRKLPDGGFAVRLVNHAAYAGADDNLGYNERLRHLEALSDGAPGFVVMCRAEDASARPRKIASFDERDLMQIGGLIDIDGDAWGVVVARVPVKGLLSSDGSA